MTASIWPTLRDGRSRYELRLWSLELTSRVGSGPAGEELEFLTDHSAQRFFRQLMADEANLDVLRDFLARDFRRRCFYNLHRASEQSIAQVLAWAVMQKDLLRVVRIFAPVGEVLYPAEVEVAPPPVARPASSWIEVKAVWDETGEPVSGLPLVVEGPDGRTEMRSTDSDGHIRVEPVDSGACEARCSFAGLSQAECAVFLGMGEGNVERQKRSLSSGKKCEARPRAIVEVFARKVRSGETPQSIAQEAGLKWEDLAFFNWATRAPEEIDRHLLDDVGCTKRAAEEGTSFVFDDSDAPGVILVPRRWKQPGLATRRQHIVRVGPVGGGMIHLRVHLGDEPPDQRSFRLFSTDGSCEQTKTAADDARLDDGAETLDLFFSGCSPNLRYSFEAMSAGASPETYFEDVPYDELAGAAPQAPDSEQPAGEEGNEEGTGSQSGA